MQQAVNPPSTLFMQREDYQCSFLSFLESSLLRSSIGYYGGLPRVASDGHRCCKMRACAASKIAGERKPADSVTGPPLSPEIYL